MVPSGATVTPAVELHRRPSGSDPQCTPGRYGVGRSLRAPSSDTAGSETGYWPGGKIGCVALAGGVAGTPHESAFRLCEPAPVEDVCAYAGPASSTSAASVWSAFPSLPICPLCSLRLQGGLKTALYSPRSVARGFPFV